MQASEWAVPLLKISTFPQTRVHDIRHVHEYQLNKVDQYLQAVNNEYEPILVVYTTFYENDRQ